MNLRALLFMVLFTLCATVAAAETVGIKFPGGQMPTPCEIMKVSKAGVILKADGKEQSLPLEVLSPKEVLECYKQVIEPFNATLRMDMGAYFCKKQLFTEAEEEILAAVKLDAALKTRADELLKTIAEKKVAVAPVKEKPPEKTPVGVPPKESKSKTETPGEMDISPGEGERAEDFAARFKRAEIAARTPEKMKEFLDKRQEELNKTIGGKWRLIETKHFYCFANIAEDKHKHVANDWLENANPWGPDGKTGLYPLLCKVLKHKEGDKLWNNKCPIYFFDKYSEFQEFAAVIDQAPGAGNSGGYFSSSGREVHICIPFMTQCMGEKAADRQAFSTLYHEGTHAFLQLSGEDVRLSRWLHEGLAQFIEFWYDRKNNPERAQRVDYISREIRGEKVPSWSSMKERPMGGMDTMGYAWAWIKLEYLYRRFPDNQKLPNMIRLIKSGKNEDEAMEKAFGQPVDKLELDYGSLWLKSLVKSGFRFE